MRKWIGFLLLGIGAAVVIGVAAVHLMGGQQEPHPGVEVTELAELDRFAAGELRTGDAPRIELPREPGRGALYHVSGDADPGGDGSRQRPWRSLSDAMCRLRPGDRLVVLTGGFTGPLAIAGDCVDGTPDRPIEVYFWDDVSVRGIAAGAPVLTIGRSHWTIAGLQVVPGPAEIGIAIAPGVEGVALQMVKVNRGAREGVRVGYGARGIRLSRLHVHHMGFSEEETTSPPGSEPAAAVAIEPGVAALRITESKFHQIGGEPVRIIAPDSFPEAPGLPAAELAIDEATRRPGDADQWWRNEQ
jgi:hypothetical protein